MSERNDERTDETQIEVLPMQEALAGLDPEATAKLRRLVLGQAYGALVAKSVNHWIHLLTSLFWLGMGAVSLYVGFWMLLAWAAFIVCWQGYHLVQTFRAAQSVKREYESLR